MGGNYKVTVAEVPGYREEDSCNHFANKLPQLIKLESLLIYLYSIAASPCDFFNNVIMGEAWERIFMLLKPPANAKW